MYEVVIIGSGPAGLSAAVYGKRAMLKTLVIEKAGYSGGQIVNTSDVDNYLGLKGISGFDMAMNFREHAEHFGAEFIDGCVVEINEEKDKYLLKLLDGNIVETKSVIIATGASYKKLGSVGEKEYTGKGVSYCATCDGAFYKNKTVAVVGGGDVALEDAIHLSKIADKVYLIHRRDQLRGAKALQDIVFGTDNIEFVADTVVSEIVGNGVSIEKINITNVKTKKESSINVNGVFIAIGMEPDTAFLRGMVDCDRDGYIVANEDGITSKTGIFVAGDCRTKKLRQVITAVSDGANAVFSVEKYLSEVRR